MLLDYDARWWIGVPGLLSVVLIAAVMAGITALLVWRNSKAFLPLGITVNLFMVVSMCNIVFHISEEKTTIYSNTRIEYGYDQIVDQLEEGYGVTIKSMESPNHTEFSDPAFRVVHGDKVELRWIRDDQEELCELLPQSSVDVQTLTQQVDVFCNDVLVSPLHG